MWGLAGWQYAVRGTSLGGRESVTQPWPTASSHKAFFPWREAGEVVGRDLMPTICISYTHKNMWTSLFLGFLRSFPHSVNSPTAFCTCAFSTLLRNTQRSSSFEAHYTTAQKNQRLGNSCSHVTLCHFYSEQVLLFPSFAPLLWLLPGRLAGGWN
jgi:hypothetical protein